MYNNFKKMLGEYDAVNEFIELIVRDFNKRYQNEIKEKEFLEKKSKEHNIFITSYDSNIFLNKISTNYIVSVNQCFESFLQEVNSKGKKIGKYKWNERKREESWLTCIVNNILNIEEKKEIENIIDLCEYYRLIRNCSVHSFSENKECEKKFKLLQKDLEHIKTKYPKLDAPNEINKIGFDDFIIFSRASKDIAKCIYKAFKYDAGKIYEQHNWKNMKCYKNNPQRLKRAVEHTLKIGYNVDKQTMDEIVKRVNEYII